MHRKRLIDQGLYFAGERIDRETELLRSKDIWFRPVQLGDGPDGSLYIADMCREVIEHPKSLPPQIKQHLDLTSGRDRGRIWRLVPASRPQQTNLVSLHQMTPSEWIEQLGHPIAWRRLTAHRLLTELHDEACVPELAKFIDTTSSASGRLLAMHLLALLKPEFIHSSQLFGGLERFSAAEQTRLLQHALIVLEDASPDTQNASADAIISLASHPSPRVRLQLLLSSQHYPAELRQKILGKTLQLPVASSAESERETAKWITASTLNATDRLADLVQAWVNQERHDEAWFPVLLNAITSELQRPENKRDATLGSAIEIMRLYAAKGQRESQVLLALAKLNQRSMAEPLLKAWFKDETHVTEIADARLGKIAVSSDQATSRLLSEAANWGRLASQAKAHAWFKLGLHPSQDSALQIAVVDALQWRGSQQDFGLLAEAWPQLTGQVQARAWSALVGNPVGLDVLEAGLKSESNPLVLNGEQQRQLREHPRKEVRERFAKLLVAPSRGDVNAVMKQYVSAMQSHEVNIELGKQAFNKVCAACHSLGGQGADVGPPLGGNIAEKTDEQLLLAILDPSREVDPKYLGYTVLLDDGRVLSGLLLEETSEALLLAVSGGQRHRIERSAIEELKRTGKSLMPEGLESQVRPEEMGSLIHYLKSSVRK